MTIGNIIFGIYCVFGGFCLGHAYAKYQFRKHINELEEAKLIWDILGGKTPDEILQEAMKYNAEKN